MKINVNGELIDATPEQEAQILAFQAEASKDMTVYKMVLQMRIDETAQTRQYRDGFSCASYYNSTNEQWSAEAQAFIVWRDAVYAQAFNVLAQVQTNEIEPPSIPEFLESLPILEWP